MRVISDYNVALYKYKSYRSYNRSCLTRTLHTALNQLSTTAIILSEYDQEIPQS